MKRISILLASTALSVGVQTCTASPLHTGDAASAHSRQDFFRLHVVGSVTASATFWLAYGPVAGKFGLIRLVHKSAGDYEAAHAFPAGARGILAFIAGRGSMRTQAGTVPGNPVVTIERTGIILLGNGQTVTAGWTAPRG